MLTIGIIREGKNPSDNRVVLNPTQCKWILDHFHVNIIVEPSPNRCFSDHEYESLGIEVNSKLDNADVLIGIKEVPIGQLIENKTYLFFSHTIKMQPANKILLQNILNKNIRLIDFELITDDNRKRLIAFGEFAGMVGAHNALYTWGSRTKHFSLPRMYQLKEYEEAKEIYEKTHFPALKIVLTGTGRVGNGAAMVLRDMGIKEVSVYSFLNENFNEPVFVQLKSEDYLVHKSSQHFDRQEFHEKPFLYKSMFLPFTKVADIFINGIFWNTEAPAFFTNQEMQSKSFKIKVIADLTCDLVPKSSLPSTLRESTIANPIYSYLPRNQLESHPHDMEGIDVMAIGNLPNELPRDASTAFGKKFIERVLPDLLSGNTPKLVRSTIAQEGKLTELFSYLSSYVSK